MKNDLTKLKTLEKAGRGEFIRVCAFGSSNTQRFTVGMQWFDYVELGFKKTFGGGVGQFINAGISGNTSGEMLERFERDVALFRPDLTIITCGGNDSNPLRNISEQMFKDNLTELHARLTALGSEVIFQTYYACDLEKLDPAYAAAIPRYMQTILDTAESTNSYARDNYTRWERLRKYSPQSYRLLMRDLMHVNPNGNMVIGLDWMRAFGFQLEHDCLDYCRVGLLTQDTLDLLEKMDSQNG